MRSSVAAVALALFAVAAKADNPVPSALTGKWAGNAAVAYGSPIAPGTPFVCLPEVTGAPRAVRSGRTGCARRTAT